MLSVVKGKDDVDPNRLDGFKWFVSVALILGGAAANYYYTEQQPWFVRAALLLVLLVGVLWLLAETTQGKVAIEFLREARVELRKVVWPTRQETMQSTFLVMAMVVVSGLVLWGIDALLLWAVGWITGQRG